MIFLSPFLLSISSNIDTLSVSSSYGIKKIYLPKSSIILLTIITTLFTFIPMYIGNLILPLFGPPLDNLFGGVLLSFIGVSLLIEDIRLKEKNIGYDTSFFYESPFKYKNILENPTMADSDESNHIDIKECFILSISIAINNMLIAFAAGVTGINIGLSIFFYFIISITTICLGYFKFNLFITKWINKHSYLVSSIVLIVLGIYETFV